MGPDRYKIRVLHYVNPHLIWVEVVDSYRKDKIHFEQIGIYGVLPMILNINSCDEVMLMQRCENWVPAANIALEKLLETAKEVWFSLTLVNRSASIFDDNTHKFGDIIFKTEAGMEHSLQEELVKSNFALQDECSFHKALTTNSIQSTLNYVEMLQVQHILQNSFTSHIPKDIWLDSLKSQMTVFQMAVELDSVVTSKSSTKTNSNMLWEKKMQVLKNCADSNESPLGRATKLKSFSAKSTNVTSSSFKKKLGLLKVGNGISNGDNYKDSLGNDIVSHKENNHCNLDKNHTADQSTKSIDQPKKTMEPYSDNHAKTLNAKKPPAMKLVAFGPPGCNPSKLQAKLVPKDDPKPVPKASESDPQPTHVNDMFAKEDSEIDIKITNLDVLKAIEVKTTAKSSVEVNPGVVDPKEVTPPNKTVEVKSIKGTAGSLQRKLRYRREMTKEVTPTPGLAKNSIENDSDDESVSDIVEKLNLSSFKNENEHKTSVVVNDVIINVNPYKNVDGSQSVFVDKLVTPILMVHTKKNNRLQTYSNLRDIPFGADIHVTLKNMAISSPMRTQTLSWTTLLRGHSLFLISPSSSGKTMGYLPPICRLVADNKKICDGFGPACIIVCATSKSVSDVENVSRMFLHEVRIFACYTGMDDMVITTALLNGCDLLICTPCMLVRLIQRDFGVDLRNLSNFVLDDCERISEVYPTELKFALVKIKEMLKIRANKEWKVQFVVASRIWCDFMTSLAKRAPDSVVCIGSFQECVLYSKTSTSVDFVKVENKLNVVVDFMKGIDRSKKTVIACRTDKEVHELVNTLTALKYIVFASDNTMTLHQLYKLNVALAEYEEPILGPVLVCCDGNLTHLNVTDATYLVHYSLPELFSMFCKRFSVLNDNYQSIFNNGDSNVKIKILLDDTNVEQLPKILNFVQRCTDNVPDTLNKISERLLVEKDLVKAKAFVPLCGNLLISGKCPDLWYCNERHGVFKEYDTPKVWMPRDGVITFKILHYNSAVSYSVRLLTNVTKGTTKKYPQNYSLLPIKMGLYYSKEVNKTPHGIPVVGDVCAVALKQNLFARCQIMKILKLSNKGTPELLLIKLVDEEKYETTRDVYLYHLPDELKAIETHVARVVLSNIVPEDRDVTFSELARSKLKKITDKDEDMYVRGQVTLVIGNTVFVDTLEACQDLSSLNEVVVKHDFKKELLNGHAILNPDHMERLKALCLDVPSSNEDVVRKIEIPKTIKVLPKGRWAHLDSDDFMSVFYASADNPGKFYVRLSKFKVCHDGLVNDIKKYVADSPEPLSDFNVGDIVLAKSPADDGLYERAKIDYIYDLNKVKCFFVDQGDHTEVYTKDIYAITERFITQLPFQAIECKLVGIQPFGDDWTEFSTNWFVDSCFDMKNELKYLYAKYFSKETAECTDGHKYSVVLIDTSSEKDIIINKLMIDLNLARPNEYAELLNETDFKREDKVSDIDTDDEETVNFSNNTTIMEPPDNVFFKEPIRSVPLVDSDEESNDSWEFTNGSEFVSMLNLKTSETPQPKVLNTKVNSTSNRIKLISKMLPAIKAPYDSDDTSSVTSDNKSNMLETATVKSCLDSDDTSSVSSEMKTVVKDLRQPKLFWRQNKSLVTVKIQLIGVVDYKMAVEERNLTFNCNLYDVDYGFNIELYGGVDKEKSTHESKGQYILVKLSKIMKRNWLSLAKGGNAKWMVYDADGIEVSSDEEEKDNNTTFKINNFDGLDSDSDDDFRDDAIY